MATDPFEMCCRLCTGGLDSAQSAQRTDTFHVLDLAIHVDANQKLDFNTLCANLDVFHQNRVEIIFGFSKNHLSLG